MHQPITEFVLLEFDLVSQQFHLRSISCTLITDFVFPACSWSMEGRWPPRSISPTNASDSALCCAPRRPYFHQVGAMCWAPKTADSSIEGVPWTPKVLHSHALLRKLPKLRRPLQQKDPNYLNQSWWCGHLWYCSNSEGVPLTPKVLPIKQHKMDDNHEAYQHGRDLPLYSDMC